MRLSSKKPRIVGKRITVIEKLRGKGPSRFPIGGEPDSIDQDIDTIGNIIKGTDRELASLHGKRKK